MCWLTQVSNLDQNLLLTLFVFIREAQAVAKGLVLEDGEDIPQAIRRKQVIKRINEWEKFEANCHMLKEIEKEKKKLKRQIEHRRHKSVDLEGITQSSDVICKFRNLRKVHSAAVGLAPCPSIWTFFIEGIPEEH